VEGLVVGEFASIYSGRSVLVTGHTGFKGSWLATWLKRMGARVTGFALDPPTQPNHWELLKLGIDDRRGDIRVAAGLADTVRAAKPDIVFHLAAQPLVRASYRNPLETWASNVQGVAHVLDACRDTGVKAAVIVTTDKVYENREWAWGYRENDRLGGHDPYSASKAAAELVVDSYRKSFFSKPGSCLVASARAGNVIGGGDWSEDRLVPDLVRATEAGKPLEIRSPNSTRPWQHVLESLSGYLLLGQRLLEGDAQCAEAFNFGPGPGDNRSVAELLTLLGRHWSELRWVQAAVPTLHESGLLYLDNSKVRARLGWQPVWELEECVRETADWYRALRLEKRLLTDAQIDRYVTAARAAGCSWARA
jgi:CDP-glucose 4,6-dehydratase